MQKLESIKRIITLKRNLSLKESDDKDRQKWLQVRFSSSSAM